jgi:hypothetical protein
MPSGRRVLGGHVVQLERTAAALAAVGLDVQTEFTPTLPSSGFDLVHGFGLEAKDIRYWHSRGVPVALSTIYWERSYRMDGGGRRPSTRALAGRGVRAAQFGMAAPTSCSPTPSARARASDMTWVCRPPSIRSPTASTRSGSP